jgi:hypothetical protein
VSIIKSSLKFKGIFEISCHDKNGNFKWKEIIYNLTLDAAINDNLTVYFKDGTKKTTWYVGLKSSAEAVSAAWTPGNVNNGFTEFQLYDETYRPTWTSGSVSAKSLSNTASPAVFTVNDTGTVWGAFLISEHTKGGTTGILWCCSNLVNVRNVIDNDVMTVIYTITGTDV